MIRKLYLLGVKFAGKLGLYEERPREYIRLIYQLIRPVLANNERRVVLDLGCGSGWLEKFSRRLQWLLVGIDIKPSPNWNDSKGYFIVADARSLPIVSNAVDVSIALSLLEHVDNWEEILREAFRSLRPGGVLIIQLPNLKYLIEPHTKFPLLYLIPRPLKQAIAKSAGYPELKFNCTIENVLKKAQEIGFKVQGVLHHYHGEKHTIMRTLSKITPPHTFFLVLQKPHTCHPRNNIKS